MPSDGNFRIGRILTAVVHDEVFPSYVAVCLWISFNHTHTHTRSILASKIALDRCALHIRCPYSLCLSMSMLMFCRFVPKPAFLSTGRIVFCAPSASAKLVLLMSCCCIWEIWACVLQPWSLVQAFDSCTYNRLSASKRKSSRVSAVLGLAAAGNLEHRRYKLLCTR